MFTSNQRRITMGLAALLCIGLIVSCGSDESGQKQPDKTDAVTETTEVVTVDPLRAQYADIAPVPEDTNGYEFRVTVDQGSVLVNGQVQWDSDEENGDTINDAIYQRNLAVEEQYNCTISLLTAEEDDLVAKKAIMAGDDFTDIMIIDSMSQTTDLCAIGLFSNLSDMPELHLDAPWWDQPIRELAIYGKQFVTTGAITIKDDLSQMCVMFNKELAAKNDYNDFYQHVLDGTWTWELMKNRTKDIYSDLNGDGEMGPYDLYGMITFDDGPYFMAVGANMHTVIYDNATESYLSNWESEDVMTKLMDYVDFAISTPGVIIRGSNRVNNTFGDDGKLVDRTFRENRALFWVGNFGATVNMRDMESDFGLLPIPKWNEEQKQYCCTVTGGSAPVTIPTTVSDPHITALITDAMAYESMFTLTPAFYDVFLDEKILRDEDSLATVDLMFASKKYDFDWQLDITEIDRSISDMVAAHSNNLVKKIASSSKRAQKLIDKYIEKYED
ncbi:MAG: hypothetical protein IJW77_09355 [Clostridia bacterium]|nr:hypothetical protein [Clostridia bacterium]